MTIKYELNKNPHKLYSMKKSIIQKMVVFVTLSLVFLGCDNKESYIGDTRLQGVSELRIQHPNPKTGAPYTSKELADLEYDPANYESYSESQTVELTLVSSIKPLKGEVVLGSTSSVLASYTEFTQIGDKFTFVFTTDVTALGMEEFDKEVIVFNVTYDNAQELGIKYPSKESISIVIQRLEGRVPSEAGNYFVYLKKKNKNPIGLNTADIVSSREKDPHLGSIISFDGVDDQVEIKAGTNLNFMGTGDFSVGLWVNTTATNSDPSIIGDKDWNGGANKGFVFAFLGNSWKLNAGDGENRVDISSSVALNDGEWHFISATFDRDGDVTIYQDGVVQGNADISPIYGADLSSGLAIRLAQDGTGAYGSWFQGQLGDVFIYDYSLTPEEMANEAHFYTGAMLDTNVNAPINIGVTNIAAVETSEEGRFTYTFDGSSAVTWDNGSELEFRNTGDFTIATWVNTTATNSDPSIISDKDWGGGSNKGFVFAFLGSNWKLNAGDGSNRIDLEGGIVNDGKWHLLAVSFDRDGNATMYEDGVMTGSVDMSGLGDMNSGFPIRLGQDGTGAYGVPYQGKIANSMIFNYALSSEEIAALY